MNARLLTIGDEILIGQIVDTNSAWLGERLTSIGIDVVRADSIGDDRESIAATVREALARTDLLVVTGGLGPTHDDVTKAAVMDVFGVACRFDERVFSNVKARFERRGIAMPDSNRSQAEIPDGFQPLDNPVGTAPGLWRSAGPGFGALVVMPGVPHEMKAIADGEMIPRLIAATGRRSIALLTLLTTGIGESSLQDRLAPLEGFLGPECSLAYLPSIHGVRLRMTGRGADDAEAEGRLAPLREHVRSRAARWIYGEGEDTLEQCVGRGLLARSATVSTAESCTGGLVAHRLTNVPGASTYVIGGVVAYANDVKTGALGVSPLTIERHGAVSREVALEMAAGARRLTGSDFAISTTGIMGPGGGTPEKPVGSVWIAVAGPDGADYAVRLSLGTDRLRNKERAATGAIDLLRRVLDRSATGEIRPAV